MKRALLALALLTLVACRPGAVSTPESRLMSAVMGTQDFGADARARLPDRLRRQVVWHSKVPVAAQALTVTYDQDQRPLAWRADLTGSQDSAEALAGGPAKSIGQWQGRPLSEVTGGPLRGSLLATGGGSLTLMSAAYAAHYEQAAARLLPEGDR